MQIAGKAMSDTIMSSWCFIVKRDKGMFDNPPGKIVDIQIMGVAVVLFEVLYTDAT